MVTMTLGENTVEYDQAGTGPDIVLLPTLLAEMSVYDEVINDLRQHNRVTRFNFPGFGQSTGPIEASVAAYADLMSEAMKSLGLPPETDIIGNGFGGFIAGTMAIRHGDTFQKLILMDSGPGFPAPAQEILRGLGNKAKEEGMGGVLDAAIKRMFPEPFITRHPDIITRRKECLSEVDPDLLANAAFALADLDNAPKLKDIKNPTLVVVGLEDATTPPALSYQLAEGIAGAELIELPEIGHCPQLQDPAGFLRVVMPFLGLS